MEIRLRNENDDAYEISNVYEESWKYAYKGIIPQSFLDSIPKGKWASKIDKMGCLVADDNGKIVGTAGFCGSRWEKYKEYGEIVSIYFIPDYIGKGYGKMLIEACIDELRKSGYEKVLLWVLEENSRARRFYEKNGFVVNGDFLDDTIDGKNVREIMYVKNIA